MNKGPADNGRVLLGFWKNAAGVCLAAGGSNAIILE
jgi:hypothetical protein